MSWLWIPILIVWIAAAVNGYRRGFLKIFLRFILSIVMFVVCYLIIEFILRNHTPMLQQVEELCTGVLSSAFESCGELNRSGQVSFINNLPLLDFIKNDIVQNNNSVIYELFSVKTFQEYIVTYLAIIILKVVSFFLSLLVSDLFTRVIVEFFDIFAKLPIIGSFNRVCGLVFGLGKGLLYLWIFFAAMFLLMGTAVGQYVYGEVLKDPGLYYLYENNVLIQYLVSWIGH